MNRNFTLLLTGQSLANIGDVLYMVSIINLIFIQSGSAAAASFVPFTITSAMFLSSILTPLLFGKISLKWLMTGSQVGKTFLLIALAFGLFFLADTESYFWIFIVIGLIALLDGCANPIRQALIPHYVESKQLLKANSIGETVTQLVQMFMWFTGSLLLLVISSQEIIWIVACLFILSSILLSLLDEVPTSSMEQGSKREQLKKGWGLLSSIPVLRQITKIDILETIAGTVWVAAIILVFVTEALNRDERWWGFINGAYFCGLIIGSIYCVKYVPYIKNKIGTVILWSSVATSLVTLLFSINYIPSVAMLLSLLIGFFGQVKAIPQQTVIQTSVRSGHLASVYTSLGAISTGIFGLSTLLMGIIADLFGVRAVFAISAAFLGMASLLIFRHNQLFSEDREQEIIS